MYPYNIIGNISLYEILLALGVVVAIIVFRIVADKLKIGARLFNFTLICALCAIAAGLGFSVLFQALYNIGPRGAFVIDKDTGATFAGGLIGGAATFIAVYFIFGKKAGENYKNEFRRIADCAACAIPAGHAVGRVGCLMDGCCYGRKTESFIGIHMQNLGYKVVPTQLFEAIFLALLAAVLVYFLIKRSLPAMSVYLLSYGVWRFVIEFFRDDYRGESLVPFLTPSQLIAILMAICGAVLLVLRLKRARKKAAEND